MNVQNGGKSTAHDGSTFDSFLEEEGIREEVEAVALKRVKAWQIERAPQEQKKTTNDRGNLNALVGKNHSDRAVAFFGARINPHHVTSQSHGLQSVRPGRFHGHL